MKCSLATVALMAEAVTSFPFVSNMPGVDSGLFKAKRQQPGGNQLGGEATCPYNPNHEPAGPITSKFPYNGAINGIPGKGQGGYQVPAPGDTAHQFKAPRAGIDIRGPCPGLNAAANHNFLPRDGVTTFDELVDAQQNLYNVGYDLANLLALVGLTLTDGDILTEKLSIGCDATSRTSFSPTLTGSEPGLDGHNKFESDTSLTRNDYFLADGDNYSFNGTLFKMMTDTTGGVYDRAGIAKYRHERYQQSLQDNPNFYFGPLSLLVYGAASFLYELMPSGTHNYIPDEATISTFFGATKNSDGTYSFNGEEKIPANWTNRVEPYTNSLVFDEILAQYLAYPVLFGGRSGNGSFDLLDYGVIKNGKLSEPDPDAILCLVYQLTTSSVPSSLNSVVTPVVGALSFVLSKIGDDIENLGCPIALT